MRKKKKPKIIIEPTNESADFIEFLKKILDLIDNKVVHTLEKK